MGMSDIVNEQIAAHTGLIYKRLRDFNLTDDQDAESCAYEALHNAVLTYDMSKGYAFSTYASCVIGNALRMHLRRLKRKRQLDVISYYTPYPSAEGLYLLDAIKVDNDAASQFLSEEACFTIANTFAIEKNKLSTIHRDIIDMWYYSTPRMTQTEIAEEVHVSQVTVSRVISGFTHKLKKALEERL
jgi:RNA polymerase sigma factor (sigma-70 family)